MNKLTHNSFQASSIMPGVLLSLTLVSGYILSSTTASADNDTTIDEVTITVPEACTLSGTGMNSHTATIPNGTYQSNIGTTTLKAYCNDSEGFAIYAIGFTNNSDGKNVLTGASLSSDYDIATGTGTSGNSQWAMKLATITSPTPTYPITIQNSFDSYHTVPDDYTMVAKRTAGTDTGANAEGSTLTTTYQAYISGTQPAGTYTGQVKYVMVHPNDANPPVREDQIAVVFDGNGLAFQGGATKNRVVYSESCTPMHIGTPEIVKTSNIANDGTKQTAYTPEEHILQTKSFTGADKVRVVVQYGLTDEAYITIAEGEWDGWDEEEPSREYYYLNTWDSEDYMLSGAKTYTFDSDTVTIEMNSWNTPESGYDYGMYAQVYPLYETEQSGTVETSVCEYAPQTNAYVETTIWKGKWYSTINNELVWFKNQSAVEKYISNNDVNLLGSTLELFAYNPYTIHYNGNGATAGTMDGFYTNMDTLNDTANLMAYNFKKTGYGFAGWSPDQNATVNSNSKIYGPNEKIVASELTYNNNKDTTLYAVWVPSAGSLQGWSGCSSMSSGQVTALTDTRDNNVYTVGKMQDGKCWMMENLRLDAANSSDSTKAQGFGGVFTGLANSEDAHFDGDDTTANSKYSTSNITGSYQGYRFPRYNNNNTNINGTNSAGVTLTISPGLWNASCAYTEVDECSSQFNEGNNNHVQWYGYGNYYSFSAASANTTIGNSSSSICPFNWHLPSSTSSTAINNDFINLNTQMGGSGNNTSSDNEDEEIVSNRWRKFPNNFVYSGVFWDSTTGYRGRNGFYWSGTRYISSEAYSFDFSKSSIELRHRDFTTYGESVRCLNEAGE